MHANADTDDDSIERFEITDRHDDTWAVASYHDARDPLTRFSTWVIDFENGDRLTGDQANEVARLLMNDGDEDGLGGSFTADWPAFDQNADSILSTIVWDDDSRMARITIRGVRVWFRSAIDQGDDVVLYESHNHDSRAGYIEAATFDADALIAAVQMERRRLGASQ